MPPSQSHTNHLDFRRDQLTLLVALMALNNETKEQSDPQDFRRRLVSIAFLVCCEAGRPNRYPELKVMVFLHLGNKTLRSHLVALLLDLERY